MTPIELTTVSDLMLVHKQECIPVGCVPPARRPYLPGPGGGGDIIID